MVRDNTAAAAKRLRALLLGLGLAKAPRLGGWATSPMPTDQLILALAADLRPVAPVEIGSRLARAAAAGGVISALLLSLAIGSRPQLAQASMFFALAVKLLFAASICGLALWVAGHLSRPGGDDCGRRHLLVLPILVLSAVALGELIEAPFSARAALVLGTSALACPGWIMLSSLPPLAVLFGVMRTRATTRPGLTGAVLGVGAGGAGAGAYALFCVETAMPFISLWYTLGVAGAAVIGAVAGARLLRW